MIDRTEWIRTLKTLPTEQLLALTNKLSKNWIVRAKAVSQSGLGMLKLQDSAIEEAFYLGEFPLASAWLEVKTPDGCIAEGAAQVMDDRIELAEALAMCDAILSASLPGWQKLAELIDQGSIMLEATDRERKKMLASTRVDFSLLDNIELDDVGPDNEGDDNA